MKKEQFTNASEERNEGREEIVVKENVYFDAVDATAAAEYEGFCTNGSKSIPNINLIPEEKKNMCIEEKTFSHIHGKVIGRRLNEKGLQEIQKQKEKQAKNGILKFT